MDEKFMKIDDWFSQNELHKLKISDLSEEERQELKKNVIKTIITDNTNEETQDKNSVPENDYFLKKVVEFNAWLNARTYLKGDRTKIRTWIKNLYRILDEEESQIGRNSIQKAQKKDLIKKFRQIPPRLLEEKTRIALNKKLEGKSLTSSNSYYLKKLKKRIKEKIKVLKYYLLLRELLEL
ncbi:MAG: hypothetical protein BAJALOKI1v1_1080005 [Promethearchaeota archaeon]|nr:MAG: hypothetical protein BAJALOKI1v1_1080005 [Candidatus Lokiarchaeota archaeon]